MMMMMMMMKLLVLMLVTVQPAFLERQSDVWNHIGDITTGRRFHSITMVQVTASEISEVQVMPSEISKVLVATGVR